MALRPPGDDKNLIPVTFFPNQGGGFGHGITQDGDGQSLAEGYDRTINMTVTNGGRSLSPSFATALYASLSSPYPPAFIVPWSDPAGTPLALVGLNTGIRVVKNAAQAGETDATSARYFGHAFHDNGAGVAYLYAGTEAQTILTADVTTSTSSFSTTVADTTQFSGSGTFLLGTVAVTYTSKTGTAFTGCTIASTSPASTVSAGATIRQIGFINRRTQGGVWEEDGDVRAKFLVSSAGALWRSTSDYQVSKCPAGSDPFSSTAWGSAFQVGTNEAQITQMGAIGAAPLVFKEDGIYSFNEDSNRFDPIYRVPIHPNNFPFVEPDGEGGIYTSEADGDIIRVQQFGAIIAANPLRHKHTSRDTPRGRIVDMAVHGDKVYALMDRGAKIIQPPGLVMLNATSWSSAVFENITASVTDQRFDTYFDASSFPSFAADRALLVGSDDQFLLMDFVMNGVNVSTTATKIYQIRATSQSNISPQPHNGTDTNPDASVSFGKSGAYASRLVSISSWTQRTLTDNAGTDHTKYWLLIAVEAD